MMNRKERRKRNISGAFKADSYDAEFASELMKLQPGPARVQFLRRYQHLLTDYCYWFTVSTLWVEYSGWTPIEIWRELFSSNRPQKAEGLMKPSERRDLRLMPREITLFRAHRADETDCIAYTTRRSIALKFANARPNGEVAEYIVPKSEVTAYFTRRGEFEIIVLDRSKLRRVNSWPIEESVRNKQYI